MPTSLTEKPTRQTRRGDPAPKKLAAFPRSGRTGTLPDGVRPAFFPTSENAICSTLVYRGSGNAGGMLQITGDGSVRVYTPSTNKYYAGQIVFPIARQ